MGDKEKVEEWEIKRNDGDNEERGRRMVGRGSGGTEDKKGE